LSSTFAQQLKEIACALSPIKGWMDMNCFFKALAVYKVEDLLKFPFCRLCGSRPIIIPCFRSLELVALFTNKPANDTSLQAPGVIILRLCIPVVDEDRPKNNWCRPLNSLHCIIASTDAIFLINSDGVSAKRFILYITTPFFPAALYYVGGVLPVYAVVMLCGFIFSIVVFCTSTSEEPPKYHWVSSVYSSAIKFCSLYRFLQVFAFLGFAFAVIWIQAVANEIVNILRVRRSFIWQV
jgi:hypothetical protein